MVSGQGGEGGEGKDPTGHLRGLWQHYDGAGPQAEEGAGTVLPAPGGGSTCQSEGTVKLYCDSSLHWADPFSELAFYICLCVEAVCTCR